MAGDRVPINLGQDGYDVNEGLVTEADPSSSVRRFTHNGHTVEIETHYRIIIDGVEFPDHIHVADNGAVHYHGLPQYSTPSAVDLVRRIVERLSDTPPPPPIGAADERPDDADHDDHGAHGHGAHGHGGA
ncbi:MAG: hypothetical protein ACKVWR_11810 [Acidimicrobiales bacterium]